MKHEQLVETKAFLLQEKVLVTLTSDLILSGLGELAEK